MSVEFRATSDFRELAQIAEQRNASPEWREVLEIKPSIGRVVKLRGRLPTATDIPDILFDLTDFAGISMSHKELLKHLSKLAEIETTYYPLAENLGARAAISSGLYEKIPDFIDVAKDLTARIVWVRWRPEKGEDFIDLHRKIIHQLKRGLVFGWNRNFSHEPFSYLENYELVRSTPVQEIDNKSPQARPIFRLRAAARHLSLPSVIAGIEKAKPVERIASLALMGYYPDGRGFTEVAKEIGVKRETLSEALDRASDVLIQTQNGVLPQRGIREIVEDLIETAVMRYPSGKNVQRTNPRLRLFELEEMPTGISAREKEIVFLATQHRNGTLIYSSEDIAGKVGSSKPIVCRVIKRVAGFAH